MFVPRIIGSGANTPYVGDIGHSLRCRSAATAYLSRTPASAGNLKTWTFSAWVKRAALGVRQDLFSCGTGAPTGGYTTIYFDTDDKLKVVSSYPPTPTNDLVWNSSAVYRDPTSWFHLCVICDTTQSEQYYRLLVYVNNVYVPWSAFSPIPAQNADLEMNRTIAHNIGRFAGNNTSYFDGYIARVAFIDGAVAYATSFGYLNTEINEWVTKTASQVKAVVDAGGTNSTMLEFEDGTSTTTLGNDYSSKNNDWTLNNFSLTAGVDYDWLLDVPGNSYATWNPLDVQTSALASPLSYGNLKLSNAGANAKRSTMTLGFPCYWEILYNSDGVSSSNFPITGIAESGVGNTSYPGNCPKSIGYFQGGGVYYDGVLGQTVASLANGDVVSWAYDPSTGKTWVAKNGTWLGSGTPNPATGANPIYTMPTTVPKVVFPYTSTSYSTLTANFGQNPWDTRTSSIRAATFAAGFKALCQRNLPDPAILNPEKHFDVLLHTGNGAASQNVTGTQFTPDLGWYKTRNDSNNHVIVDSVRGANNLLSSNLTSAEQTLDSISAFLSNGITASGTVNNNYSGNRSGINYVDWLWKLGGAPTADNVAGVGAVPTAGSVKIDGANKSDALAGSIAATRLSANTVAGQSVVTYTGTGANATVAHGLNSAPELVICKIRAGAVGSWMTYHKNANASAANGYLALNGAAAWSSYAAFMNNTAPTSTVFSLGSGADANLNGSTNVALCFHSVEGYSKVGSYVGNGAADGRYVDCGFKPKYVLIKCATTTGNWIAYDVVRNTYNVTNLSLFPNLANAEFTETANILDVTSNGFKIRGTGGDVNAAQTYIFLAFADVPAKFSLGR